MKTIDVHNQDELDAALASSQEEDILILHGDGTYVFAESSSPRVEAWESSSPRVVAWESSSIVVEQHGQARHHLVERGGTVSTIEPKPRIDTPQAWLEWYGVEVKRGICILFKAIDAEWHSSHALPDGTLCDYSPGRKLEAPDFDPAPRDCGYGLHACASPAEAEWYLSDPAHYAAIPVRVSELGTPDPDGDTRKIRFKRAAKAVYEVDVDGDPVAS